MKKMFILMISMMFCLFFSMNSHAAAVSGASCQSTGTVYIYETVVVNGTTYDGGCKTYIPVGLGDGGQAEGQDPVFRVENGGTLKNVIIGVPGADGIHLYNSATVDNVTWQDVGEDALTVKAAGNYKIRNIEGYKAHDKFFQINAACNFDVSNAIIHGAGKALRQNGGTSFTIHVTFDNCDIQDMDEAVFRTDSSSSTARITNSCLGNVGQICYGNWGSCTSSGITWGSCIVDDIPSDECQQWSARNDQHVSAGRAYTQSQIYGCDTITTYYAVGSNQNLGTSGATTTTLNTADGGQTYQVGDCSGSDPDPTCQSWTATNSDHVSANRAYAETISSGCDGNVTTYYAVGSGESLGTSGNTSTTLYTDDDGDTYHVGDCSGQ